METWVIGAIAGAVVGAAFLAILVTCIVFFSKKIKRRTNARSKLITSKGEVYKEKWPQEYKEKTGFHGKDPNQDKRLYFGDVDNTEHVEVKEKRNHREMIRPPAPVMLPPPPQMLPPPLPKPTPPRLRRFQYRSWERSRPPPFRRRPSFGAEKKPPPQYFMYGFPYQAPRPPMLVTSGAYGSWLPGTAPNPAPAPAPMPAPVVFPNPGPEPEPPKHLDIEEQERVLVFDDGLTEKSFNPRWQSEGHSHGQAGVSTSMGGGLECSFQSTHRTGQQHSTKEVPVIVADVL